jgi:hypothetical protein
VSNDGTSWVDHSINSDVELFGVSCPSLTKCFAVGFPAAIYVTIDSGVTWLPQTNPVSGTQTGLIGVSCADTTDCVVVGTGGVVLMTSNGTTWNQETSGTVGVLYAVDCTSSFSCIAVGANGAARKRSGGTWTAQTSNTVNPLLGIDCPTASTCYADGVLGTVVKTVDGGTTWIRQTTGTRDTLVGIRCAQVSICMAAGSLGTAIVTRDGSHWIDRSYPIGNLIGAVAFPDAAHAWMVGQGGTVLFNPNIVDLCASASLSADVASPQPVGTKVTFDTGSTGCSAPAYEYWLQYPSGVWVLKRGFSSASSWVWDTTGYPLGTYTIHVWANQSGESSATWESYGTMTYTLTGCTSAGLSASPPSPLPRGGQVLFTATSGGCPSPLYEYWLQDPSGTWVMKRAFSSDATWTWDTAAYSAGNYTVHVWVDQSGGNLKTWQVYGSAAYSLTVPPRCATASVLPANPSVPAGTSVSLTATSTGCPNPKYEFWIQYPNGTWYLKRGWGGDTFNWSTTGLARGSYNVHVWANQAGDSTKTWEAYGSDTVTLT